MNSIFSIASFTVAMAALATLVMLPPGVAVAWLLARRRFPGRVVLETVVSLPLVLPPVATGLILMRLLGPHGPIGAWLERFGIEVIVLHMQSRCLHRIGDMAILGKQALQHEEDDGANAVRTTGSEGEEAPMICARQRGRHHGGKPLVFGPATGAMGIDVFLAQHVVGHEAEAGNDLAIAFAIGNGHGTGKPCRVNDGNVRGAAPGRRMR